LLRLVEYMSDSSEISGTLPVDDSDIPF